VVADDFVENGRIGAPRRVGGRRAGHTRPRAERVPGGSPPETGQTSHGHGSDTAVSLQRRTAADRSFS
jgi:hypothetical protein